MCALSISTALKHRIDQTLKQRYQGRTSYFRVILGLWKGRGRLGVFYFKVCPIRCFRADEIDLREQTHNF